MQIIENIKTNKTEYSRLFWKSLAVILLITTAIMAIAWRIESYGRKMDAQVFALKAQIATQSNDGYTPETIKPTLGK